MKLCHKCLYYFFLLFLTGYVTYMPAVAPNTGHQRVQPRYRSQDVYNQNFYIQPGYSDTPNEYNPNSYNYPYRYNSYQYRPYYYGGYNSIYNSPPPPSYDQAFPDDAEQNALYRELQSR